MKQSLYRNLLATSLLSLLIGAIIIWLLGFNPIQAYIELFKGAFVGKLNLGTTLQKFVPLSLTGIAFVISARAKIFNVGLEGQLYLGAMAAALVGLIPLGIPSSLHILLCLGAAMVVGGLWAGIPGSLKVHLGVDEICVTILMNYIAIYLTSYLVNGPFSAKQGAPQTPALPEGLVLPAILKPSQAHAGIVIAIIVIGIVIWVFNHTVFGYNVTSVGLNAQHAEYVGINPKRTTIAAMCISGAIGGLAGSLEVLGVYGYFLDGFSAGLAFDGILAALIVKNDLRLTPIMAFCFAALKSGALGMERYTGVPKSMVDTIIAIFIIFATMEALVALSKRRARAKANKETPAVPASTIQGTPSIESA